MSNGGEDSTADSVSLNILEKSTDASKETTLETTSPANTTEPSETEDLTTRALRFFSTASNETLGGIAVGLAACTYFVLGRVGLVLIGAFGGVILHASWEGQNTAAGLSEESRREKGLDIIKRVLDSRDVQDKEKEESGLGGEGDLVATGFESLSPETATALKEFIDAVIRDYVKWWYVPMVPNDNTFPAASRATFTSFLLSMATHLSRKRPADTFLDFLTNSSSIAIVFLNELAQAYSTSSNSNKTASEVVYEYLAANPDSSLANVLNDKQQQRKFQLAAEDLLQNFLDKSVYNCGPARTFLKQMMAGVVLESSLKTCSKPEWINGWLVYLLEEGEPELMEAIDAGMGMTAADGIDGNVGNISLAKTTPAPTETRVKKTEDRRHKKRLSRAEEAMEEAMEEAKRLSRLIAEEDAKRVSTAENLGVADSTSPNPKPAELPSNGTANGTTNGAKTAPITPSSVNDFPSPKTPNSTTSRASFTNFDQIVSQTSQGKSPLTLHNATITIYDDSAPNDKGKIRSKPTTEYMLQIEPESSQHPGWMIPRKYADFESLHEVLRRIAAVSGVTAFTEQHSSLPHWKGHTKSSFRGELERYLRDACWYQPLAESEGMRRFLERDRGYSNDEKKGGFAGIGWSAPLAFETMGKGVIDALASAPKGAAEGGKAVFGGVTGVINNIGSLGNPKKVASSTSIGAIAAGRASMSNLSRMDSNSSINGIRAARSSEDSLRVTSPIVATQPSVMPQMERRPSYNSIAESENEAPINSRVSFSARSSISGRGSRSASREPSQGPSISKLTSPARGLNYEELNLPPPPSDITDDYVSQVPGTPTSVSTAPSVVQSPQRNSLHFTHRPLSQSQAPTPKPRKESPPLSIQETNVAVELIFAVINELYTLSSAWNIRRTLLNAAKTFLLRPGNPSLISIQSLIQDSVIASNTSDAGIASHLRKLRENAVPTEEELKSWPPEMTMEEKERLRIKARKLLVERGVPAALTGVMGQAATTEAMGRVFDCLQVEEVARGLICGILLQGVRAVTH